VLGVKALIDLYCKLLKALFGLQAVDCMEICNLVCWTLMIAGYMQYSFDVEDMDMFWQLSRAV
jgi:hypothetical protein